MKLLLGLFVVSTLCQWVWAVDFLTNEPEKAVAKLVKGEPWIFSGENVHLTCSVPGDVTDWRYQWFRGGQFIQESKDLFIWKAQPQQSEKYYCQGIRKTWISQQRSPKSLPVELKVDGGWAILRVPALPMLVGETMSLTCHVRANPGLSEVILYQDEVAVQRQSDPNLFVTNLTLGHQGSYWCRATWNVRITTVSVISSAAPVKVLELLTEPILQIETNDPRISKKQMFLVCHVDLNAREENLVINYYFYLDGQRLGPASSDDRVAVPRTTGRYFCRATVPILDLDRSSELVDYK